MLPRRRALSLVVIALLACAVAACGAVESLVHRGGDTSAPAGHAPMVPVDAPDAALVSDSVVADAAPSVVKIRAVAPSCKEIHEGSGVVVAPNHVMTNAHVVAGAENVSASLDGREFVATVVSFDPNIDIALLRVPDLLSPPLAFADAVAAGGTDGLMLGFPGDEPFAAAPAKVREVIELRGPDIFHTTTVTREAYVLRGHVVPGNAGGPLMDMNGHVLGIVFGAAADDRDTAFALTARQVAPFATPPGDGQPVATGACVR
jgi:S1-C subfamily serine protease